MPQNPALNSFPVVLAPDAVLPLPTPLLASVNDVAAPAAGNQAAVVTYPAAPAFQGVGVQHCVSGVAWSYAGGVPVNGALTIQDGANVIFSLDIAVQGPGHFHFPTPKVGTPGAAMTIMLSAGGVGIMGKLSVLGHWTAIATAAGGLQRLN